MRTVLLLFFAVSAIHARTIHGPCEVSIDYRKGDLKEPQPLILTDTEVPEFVLPDDKKILTIPFNTSIILSCPGTKNYLQNVTDKPISVRAVCYRSKQFLVDSKIYDFSNFTCKYTAKEVIKKSPSPCLGEHHGYEIGFNHNNHFLKLLEICRDGTTYQTYYTKVTIVKEIGGFQSSFPRVGWRYGNYYHPHNMNSVYKVSSQIRSIETIIDSAELARKYVLPGEQFLNRGHLAAKADFVYGSQQSVTFWLLNAAPQWASFNAGNWLRLENALRAYASERRRDLDVYTGVHGHTSLRDDDGEERKIYLHAQGERERAFPVPRYFWKVVHDRTSNRAIGFVGLNEPYAANVTKDMYICPDIGSEEIDQWIGWTTEDIEKGVSYVCSVDMLRKAVPTMPDIGEIGVIKLKDDY